MTVPEETPGSVVRVLKYDPDTVSRIVNDYNLTKEPDGFLLEAMRVYDIEQPDSIDITPPLPQPTSGT